MDFLHSKFNEYDTIVFDDYKILINSSNQNDYIKEEEEELEWLLEEEPDIYSNNHPWDARTNFSDYLFENDFTIDDMMYVPSRYLIGKPNDGLCKIICRNDRYSPVSYF